VTIGAVFDSVDDVNWAQRPLCNFCRRRDADGLADGELACITCVDLMVEREQAVAGSPELRDLLPPLRDVLAW
jgi:hypothetical protein